MIAYIVQWEREREMPIQIDDHNFFNHKLRIIAPYEVSEEGVKTFKVLCVYAWVCFNQKEKQNLRTEPNPARGGRGRKHWGLGALLNVLERQHFERRWLLLSLRDSSPPSPSISLEEREREREKWQTREPLSVPPSLPPFLQVVHKINEPCTLQKGSKQ